MCDPGSHSAHPEQKPAQPHLVAHAMPPKLVKHTSRHAASPEPASPEPEPRSPEPVSSGGEGGEGGETKHSGQPGHQCFHAHFCAHLTWPTSV